MWLNDVQNVSLTAFAKNKIQSETADYAPGAATWRSRPLCSMGVKAGWLIPFVEKCVGGR